MKRPLLLSLCAVFLAATLSAASATTSSSLRVGVGRADITPRAGIDRAIAMGGKEVVVENIHDPLTANVVVFEQADARVALVSLDLIAVNPAVFDDIRAGLERDHGITQTLCAVTHTHGSGRPTDGQHERLVSLTLQAAADAIAALEPAIVGHANGELNEGYNRRIVQPDGTVEMMWNNKDHIPSHPVDDTLGVLSIRRAADGQPIATLVNYAVHPVISMNFEELIISADWPGAMARKVEAELGGHCIFLLGAAGDINPYEADMFRYATPAETFAKIEEVASRVAAEVVRTHASLEPADLSADATLAYDSYTLPLGLRRDGPHGEKSHEVELATFLLGQRHAIVTIPGELFVELGMDLRERSPAASTWVMANAYGSSGYIPTMHAACQGGYGATWGTFLEFGAGERLVHQALVSLLYQMEKVKPLEQR
ncbi:hypothetical protein [Actomonas aquatica]|uniref:Neutral/alkaline non-lysosomal ceramidase N-terminal domain-containing protein n=1 Tax=Actomonas aquatica TaxID=2866162 RepID=A0ABZ1C549_9BACT|nr:hypothetical protein [Opitutus sp. WL0086]WRQ86463.1 hypothetical protein K1X11_016730 [Opitutus sp. WL0086]